MATHTRAGYDEEMNSLYPLLSQQMDQSLSNWGRLNSHYMTLQQRYKKMGTILGKLEEQTPVVSATFDEFLFFVTGSDTFKGKAPAYHISSLAMTDIRALREMADWHLQSIQNLMNIAIGGIEALKPYTEDTARQDHISELWTGWETAVYWFKEDLGLQLPP
ncbi:hypothetical protein TREMEDRAFT_66044 [Tremella mesenterica DSM 1558]|uniref:uncharacterized protein n=1 Tax=Tremella mesenterica (strain ATCC 24925 / CBS 8224 / DSM 1558 / NBRC 9311 / NRRL Y-6157 / RJB 2259-6 / UBC 559-6) TaxID=578456 RepID=UPI00032CF86B|nr:uncharacterized protein TREMEDRAFT_66044 [Tremella mesenterica DSM 1558]EIW65954.1 hypothetical protein TREMEDRAFT_66044 [Tremella mesenterica DSM 1558]